VAKTDLIWPPSCDVLFSVAIRRYALCWSVVSLEYLYAGLWLHSGRHTVEILHNGQAIMGSPFFVEIYDPNKIRIEGTKTGRVNERMEFDSTCLIRLATFKLLILSTSRQCVAACYAVLKVSE